MERTVLTTGELASRWGVKAETITALSKEGKLRALVEKGEGGHRKYSLPYILQVEEAGGLDYMNSYSVLSFKRLEAENKGLKEEIEKLKNVIDDFIAMAIQSRNEVIR